MPSQFGGQPISGEEYFKTLPLARQREVRALLTGNMKFPSLSRNNTYGQQLYNDAALVDPDFNQKVYDTRVAAVKDFTSGKTANLIQALNQAPQHALTLSHAYDQLHNLPAGGETLNNVLTHGEAFFGVPSQQHALGQFNASQPAVADELATVYKGGAATIPDIDAQKAAFGMGAPPNTSNSALATASELMRDRLNTLETRWQNAMGTAGKMFPVISPQAKSALDQLYAKYHPPQSQPAQSPSPAAGGPSPQDIVDELKKRGVIK